MKFTELNVNPLIIDGINNLGLTDLTEIQEKVIPLALNGSDLIGQAPTGTGKTFAFGIPILNNINENNHDIECLILAPTRELVVQITKEINNLGAYFINSDCLAIYGGELIDKQIIGLKKKPKIIVCTPGRLIDHLNRKTIRLDKVKMVILDEADEMLDMGFIDDINSILSLVTLPHQTMLFSATFNKELEEIANNYMIKPKKITVSHGSLTVDAIDQKYVYCKASDKVEIIARLIEINEYKLVMIFCNTKKTVDEVTTSLLTRGFLCEALHGDMKQMARDRVMDRFRNGTINILVASDVAARGLDISNVDVVFNYDLPTEDEYYVHRIGRTGRASKKGTSISLVSRGEMPRLRSISRYAKTEINVLSVPSLDKIIKIRTKRLLDRAIEIAQDNNNFENSDYEVNKLLSIIDKQLKKYDGVDKEILVKGLLSIIINADGRNQEIDDITSETLKEIDSRKGKNKHGEVRMFMTLGKNDDIRVYTITDMLVKNAGLSNSEINDVTIKDSFTFFNVPASKVNDVLLCNNEIRYKGRRISIQEAKVDKSKRNKSNNKNTKRKRK